MKKLAYIISALALYVGTVEGGYTTSECPHTEGGSDLTRSIPTIDVQVQGYQKISDVAQYKNGDWSQVIGIARDITLTQAKEIADSNSEITFFFYTKGYQMVLETVEGDYRVFHHGDTVFFAGEPHWGTAPYLADGYVRQ